MFILFFSFSLRFSSPRLDSTLHSMHRATSTTASYVHHKRIRTVNPFPSSPLDTISRSIHPRPHPTVYRWLVYVVITRFRCDRHACASRQRISNVSPPENSRSLGATLVLGF